MVTRCADANDRVRGANASRSHKSRGGILARRTQRIRSVVPRHRISETSLTVRDKAGLLPGLKDVHLELGCGGQKLSPSAIGIDLLDYPSVDIVGDVREVLALIGDETIDGVSSHHFFEHVGDLSGLLAELARVLKVGATLEIVVPHFSSPYYYSDYTHQTPFGLYTMSYLAHDGLFKRRVSGYQVALRLNIDDVRLRFKSPRPFYGRYFFKRTIGAIVNTSRYLQEFYEENLCYLIPCYEIQFRLVKTS